MDWQPIETAPRDRTDVLFCIKDECGDPYMKVGHSYGISGDWSDRNGNPIVDDPEDTIVGWMSLPAAPTPPPTWQPIETAPRDGTVIDLWCSHGRIPCCSWRVAGNFNGDSAWHNESGFPIEYGHPKKIPTHWMPLPEPPRESK